MFPHLPSDSPRSLTDAENACLQFVISCKHIVIETENSLVLSEPTQLHSFENGGKQFGGTLRENVRAFGANPVENCVITPNF